MQIVSVLVEKCPDRENTIINNHEEIRIEIMTPYLKRIIHEGVGDMILSGEGLQSLEIEYSGIGNIDFYDLPIKDCNIKSSGIGDCYARVNEFLFLDLAGIGNVYYRGTPNIESIITGNGQLVNDNN